MQISLKQPEIISALKQFVSSQGIALSGKTVEIKFTAGRGNTGLSADISIDDAEIPGVHLGETDSVKPVLSVVPAVAAPAAAAPEVTPQVEVALKAPTTSLFS